mgnify:FL=1
MSREAFEAWIKRDSTLSVERDGEGYRDMDVYLMWRVWPVAQADAYERAAKVCHQMSIEQKGMGYSGRTCSIRNQRAAECRDAIRALAKDVT